MALDPEFARRLEGALYDRRIALLWCGFAAASAVLFYRVFVSGDLPYVIEDMLINYADGVVRRGLGGEVARQLAGVFGGTPAGWAFAVICLLAAALFAFSARIYRHLPDDPVYLPLVLAPWGLLFLAYDPNGSFRKEVFGYLALAVILQGALSPSARRATGWVAAGSVLYVVVIFAHEAVLFLWPVLAMAIWVVARAHPSRRGVLAGLAIGAGAVAGLTVLWLAQIPPRDVAVLCAAAQLDSCTGPFGWLNSSTADGWAYVLRRRNIGAVVVYAAQSALCVVPFFGLRAAGLSKAARVALLALPFAAITPLFFLGYDWGRWIQMAFFPFSLIAVTAITTGALSYRRVLIPWLAVAYVASWSISHAHGRIEVMALLLLPVLAGLIALQWIAGRISERDLPRG